jgi:hypothetical protein
VVSGTGFFAFLGIGFLLAGQLSSRVIDVEQTSDFFPFGDADEEGGRSCGHHATEGYSE